MPKLAELTCILYPTAALAAVKAGCMTVFLIVLCLGASLQAVHHYPLPHAGLLLSGYLAQIA